MSTLSPDRVPGVLPDLLHRVAFNLCAAIVGTKRPVYLVAGNPFYETELSYRLDPVGEGGRGPGTPVLVWADPRPETALQVADQLRSFPPGGMVLALTVGRGGRRWLRQYLRGDERGGRSLNPAAVTRLLGDEGFRVTACYGIGGPPYRLWGSLARAAALLRRDDWADRWQAQARDVLVTDGHLVTFSRLLLLVARRAANGR